MIFITPASLFLPYKVPCGPLKTSILSISPNESSKPKALVVGTPSTYSPTGVE